MEFFISPFALIYYMSSLFLNRFITMSSLKSTTQKVTLPLWSRIVFRLIPSALIIFNLIQTLVQSGVIPNFGFTFITEQFYELSLVSVSISQVVEMFFCSTSNISPLIDPNFTIFELALQSYALLNFAHEKYYLDLVMALINQLSIQLLELFNARNQRFIQSAVVDLSFIFYLVVVRNFNDVMFQTVMNVVPTFIMLAIINLSIIINWRSISWSSFRSYWNQQKFSGEEEFSEVLYKFACFLADGGDINFSDSNNETASPSEAPNSNGIYMISGYNNEILTIPDDIQGDSSIIDVSEKKYYILKRFQSAIKLVKPFLVNVAIPIFNKMSSKEPVSATNQPPDRKERPDLNRLVTRRNYAKFLVRIPTDDLNIATPNDIPVTCVTPHGKYLLPENDTSGNYIPHDPVKDYAEAEELESDDDEEIKQDLVDLFDLPIDDNLELENMNWLISAWSMTKFGISKDKRLTRQEYAKLNSDKLLTEVYVERTLIHEKGCETSELLPGDDEDDEIDITCLVCQNGIRNVIFWPCRCLVMCDNCRESLGIRGFRKCISCNSDVDAYSKIHVV